MTESPDNQVETTSNLEQEIKNDCVELPTLKKQTNARQVSQNIMTLT